MTEKLTCPSDLASKAESEFLEDSLKSIRDLVPEEKGDTLTEDDLTCEICGGPDSIPPARAARGYSSCVPCASLLERKSKQYNRKPSRHYDDEE